MRTSRRIATSLAVAAAVLAIASAAGAVAASANLDRAFVIDHLDRDVVVDVTGLATVTETIDVTFRQGRRGIFRDLPTSGNGVPLDIRVTSVDRGRDGDDWRWQVEGTGSGDVRVRIGDPAITLPTGPQRYRLRYTIDGLVAEDERRPGTAQLRVDVPGDGWPTAVGRTTLRVRLPVAPQEVACVVGRRGQSTACSSPTSVTGTEVVQELAALRPFRTGTVAVDVPVTAFAPGSLPTVAMRPLSSGGVRGLDPPGWLGGVLIALAMVVPIAGLETQRARKVYRDQITDPRVHDRPVPTAEIAPPDGLRPAELASLQLRGGQERFLATLIDLEQRGLLASETTPNGDAASLGIGTTTLRPGAITSDHAWERAVVTGLFADGPSLELDGEYDAEVAERLRAATAAIEERDRQLRRPGGELVHARGSVLRGGSGFLIGLAVVAAASLAGQATAAFVGLPVGAVVAVGIAVALAWAVLSSLWRPERLALTSEGRHLTARIRAFRHFLAEVHADQIEFAAHRPGTDHHHPAVTLLPYAVALGLGDSWFARFQPLIDELAARSPSSSAAAATWWTTGSGVRTFSATQVATSTAPSSSSGGGGGGGGAGSGGGGGGGGSW